jgi:hypothetical protein
MMSVYSDDYSGRPDQLVPPNPDLCGHTRDRDAIHLKSIAAIEANGTGVRLVSPRRRTGRPPYRKVFGVAQLRKLVTAVANSGDADVARFW